MPHHPRPPWLSLPPMNEARDPGQRASYTRSDDALLRAVGIALLVIAVIAIASWPRDGDSATPRTTEHTRPR